MKNFLVLLVLMALPRYATAMLVDENVIQEQLEQAVSVVELTIESKWADPDPVFGFRWTAEAMVNRVLNERPDGRPLPQTGDTILLRGIGGEAEGMGVIMNGYPRPFVGRRYQAYLFRDGLDYSIAGLESGLIQLSAERQYTRNRTDGSDGDGSGPFLQWDPDFFPIPYFISATSFTGLGAFFSAITASFQTWTEVSGSKVSFIGLGCANSADNQNDGVNNIIYESLNWPFETGVIAITRNFFISGDSPKAGMILDSDIIFNAVNHSFTVTGEAGKFDIQNILTHEVGHLLGLGHDKNPDDTEATMYASANPVETKKRDLADNDKAGIVEAYPGVSTIGASFNLSCDISSTPSCVGVRNPCGGPASLVPAIIFLMGLLVMGRLSPYWHRV